jgi:adenosylmethionine-8-amino-7-oxononanoate aminotransferase
VALELVSDRASKAPVAKDVPMALLEEVYRNGVLIRVSGPNVILSPSLILSEADTDTIIGALDAGLAAIGAAA